MNFVLDASVALSWCFEDEGDAYPLSVLSSLRHSEAVAASLWPLEVANGLLSAERRQRITPAESARAGRLLLSLPIAIDPVARSTALLGTTELGRRCGLSSYDAAYLELAIRLGLPLATVDGRLRSAAVAEGVPLYEGVS